MGEETFELAVDGTDLDFEKYDNDGNGYVSKLCSRFRLPLTFVAIRDISETGF
jgi:hypothetical protein